MNDESKPFMHRFRTEELLVDPGPPRLFNDQKSNTYLVTLGTSTPSPNPFRFGPSGAVIIDEIPYIIDAGEGILRAIAKAATAHDKLLVDSFAPTKLTKLFLTHLHSDHVVGLPSIILNPWIFGRSEKLDIFGPIGTKHLIDSIISGYHTDINERIYGPEQANDTGWKVTVHEIESDGLIYKDEHVSVDAFSHEHGSMLNYGYVFTSAQKKIVWAGDGKVNSNFLEASYDADYLVTELCSEENVTKAPWGGLSNKEKEKIIWSYHLKPRELADLAIKARIKNLILIHESNYSTPFGINELYTELQRIYKGKLISSRDADVF